MLFVGYNLMLLSSDIMDGDLNFDHEPFKLISTSLSILKLRFPIVEVLPDRYPSSNLISDLARSLFNSVQLLFLLLGENPASFSVNCPNRTIYQQNISFFNSIQVPEMLIVTGRPHLTET